MRPEDRDRAKVEAASRVVGPPHRARDGVAGRPPRGRHQRHAVPRASKARPRAPRRGDARAARVLSAHSATASASFHARPARLLDELARSSPRRSRGFSTARVSTSNQRDPSGTRVLLATTSPRRFARSARCATSRRARPDQGRGTVKRIAERGTLVVVPTHSSTWTASCSATPSTCSGCRPLLYGAGF